MPNLINMSEAGFIALHSLALIVQNEPKRLNSFFLAKKLHASQAHIAKVFQKLNKAGLIRSTRGPAGGFELLKPAEKISFLEVYEVIEGKIELNDCFLGKPSCPFETCIFADKMSKINQDIFELYSSIKLSDLRENNSEILNNF